MSWVTGVNPLHFTYYTSHLFQGDRKVNLAKDLQQGLQALQLSLPDAIQTQLLNYLQLLAKWNRVYNLTAVRDETQMISKHLLDSLAVLSYVGGPQILDVGTGAGLPGLILAIARPYWQYILLDCQLKKVRFVRQAVTELGINNAEIVKTRIEDYQPTTRFTTIISRAYSSLPNFYHHTARLCATGGCLLAMKGTYPEMELSEMLGLPVHIEILPLQVPQLAAQRHLVVMRPYTPT